MSDIPILSRRDDRQFFNEVISYYGAPAYVRRACRVEGALEDTLQACRTRRTEWLTMTRIRLGVLRSLAGTWSALSPLLRDDDQVEVLHRLEAELQPRPRVRLEPARSPRKLRRALRELASSLERFNCRWQEFLAGVDLGPLNALRADYNRYYVLEKECAMRSPRLARQGFIPLAPLTMADLEVALPPLPVPQLRASNSLG